MENYLELSLKYLTTMKLIKLTLFRGISTFGWRGAKVETGKTKEKDEATKPTCPSGPESKSICFHEDASGDQACVPADVDPDWEMTEAVPPSGPRIVVVGAGPAGLTAADRLVAAGVKDIVILEASSRAGGRIQSKWAGDTVVELGLTRAPKQPLSWSHPLLQAAPPPIGSDPTSGLLEPPIPLPALFRALSILRGLQAEEQRASHIPGYKAVRVEQIGRTLAAAERDEVARGMAAFAALSGPSPKVKDGGSCPFVLAPGGSQIPLGECRSLLPLMKRIGCSRIHMRKEVVSIHWGTVTPDQTPRALLRCRDGSEYPAEFVLLTPSLGWMQHNLEGTFYPPLPPSKHAVIGTAPFLHENRAFLVFEEPIWSWSTKPLHFTFERCPKSACLKKGGDWTQGIVEMRREEGSERVVMVSLVGDAAVQMERATDSAAIEVLHRFLQEKLSVGDIPKPKRIIRSRWCDSRHTLGLRAGRAGAEALLAEPVPSVNHLPPVLLFAGEATSPRGGLEGALMSGLREAERLLAILGRLPGHSSREVCPKFCK